MEDYTSNSHASKEEKKERERHKAIVSASMKKPSWWAMILDGDIDSIRSRVVKDVIVPIAKNTLDTVITQTSHVIFGGTVFDNRNLPASNVRYISDYQGAYKRNQVIDAIPDKQASLATTEYNRVRYPNEAAAKAVLAAMNEQVAAYRFASVGDLYDFAGLDNSPTDYKYGWADVTSATIYRTLDGYYIKWPKAMPID